MSKFVSLLAGTALACTLALSAPSAQLGGPAVSGGGAPPLVDLEPGRGGTFTDFLSTTVNQPLALAMIDTVLKDGEVAAEHGTFLPAEDGSEVGVFNVVPLGPVIVPARLVLVRNPGAEITVVGRQAIQHQVDGGKTSFRLVSHEYPDDLYEATLEIDGQGQVVAASDNMSGLLSDPTGVGLQCVIRCYAQFVFGGFFGWPYFFWFYWGGLFVVPFPGVYGYWTIIYYLKWLQMAVCLSGC